MFARISFLLISFLLSCTNCLAVPVQVTVTSSNGRAVKGALVIVQALGPPQRELFRELTNDAGQIPPHALAPGLYRAISTYPYGHWRTGVQEFLVNNQPVKVDVAMSPTQSLDDDIPVSIGQLTVHVVTSTGQPAMGARVMVRDAEAHSNSEHWGTTSAQGITTLELSDQPSTLIVVYHDQLYKFATSGLETEQTLRLK